MKQIGDYVIVRRGHHYGVRMAGAEEYISTHETEDAAFEAVQRYRNGDRRRRMSAKRKPGIGLATADNPIAQVPANEISGD